MKDKLNIITTKVIEKVELRGVGSYLMVSCSHGTYAYAKDICDLLKLDIHNTKTLKKYVKDVASLIRMAFIFNGEKVGGTFIDLLAVYDLIAYSKIKKLNDFKDQFIKKHEELYRRYKSIEAMPYYFGKLSSLFPIKHDEIVTSKEFKEGMNKVKESLLKDKDLTLFEYFELLELNPVQSEFLFQLMLKEKVIGTDDNDDVLATEYYVNHWMMRNETYPREDKDGYIRPHNVIIVTPFGMVYFLAKYVLDWRKKVCDLK